MVSDRLRYSYAELALPHLSAGEQIELATEAEVAPSASPVGVPPTERMRLVLTERRLLFFSDADDARPPVYVVMRDGTPVTAIEYQGAQRSFVLGAVGSPQALGLVFKRATREDAAPIHAAFRSPAPVLGVAAGGSGCDRIGDRTGDRTGDSAGAGTGTLEARAITAWFGDRKVLDRVSLTMPAGIVTALIGPSGCGKSTFLRTLNRMHELVPKAMLAGEVLLDGQDIYAPGRRLTEARAAIGMVFQKPNPFPAMSVYENVVAGLALTGRRVTRGEKDALVEECLTKAGLWTEVRDRLRQPGGALSGGQQQRLCIARSLAIRPEVLLMDEPCSALDPTSTRRIEETIGELAHEVTIVIVTHNMQQAARVSQQCAFFLAAHGTPGRIIEYGPTEAMFGSPSDERTSDYVNGRFG
jgi:phosphate transport system ATP-binding protein